MPLRLSTLAPGVHLVRVLVGDGPEYDRMIVVTELDDGEVLFLQGWTGKPLSPREWRDAALRRFPRARWIVFKRMKRDQTRLVTFDLNAHEGAQWPIGRE